MLPLRHGFISLCSFQFFPEEKKKNAQKNPHRHQNKGPSILFAFLSSCLRFIEIHCSSVTQTHSTPTTPAGTTGHDGRPRPGHRGTAALSDRNPASRTRRFAPRAQNGGGPAAGTGTRPAGRASVHGAAPRGGPAHPAGRDGTGTGPGPPRRAQPRSAATSRPAPLPAARPPAAAEAPHPRTCPAAPRRRTAEPRPAASGRPCSPGRLPPRRDYSSRRAPRRPAPPPAGGAAVPRAALRSERGSCASASRRKLRSGRPEPAVRCARIRPAAPAAAVCGAPGHAGLPLQARGTTPVRSLQPGEGFASASGFITSC